MKNFTKKLALLLVFAMVLGIATPTSVAKAADKHIYINYYELTLAVYEGTDLANGKISTYDFTQFVGDTAPTTDQIKAIKDKDWVEVSNDTQATYGDISWFNKKKASYAVARVYENNAYTYVVSDKIEAQEDALKVLYSDKNEAAATTKTPAYTSAQAIGTPVTGYFVFYRGKTNPTVVTPNAVTYRIDGSYIYTNVTNADFTKALKRTMAAKGATFYFVQRKGDGTTNWTDKTGWPVKEAKYKFAAQKNAPTVKLDITHVVPLKAGQEYRIVDASNTSNKSDWVSVDKAHGKTEGNKVKVGKILLEELVCTGGTITASFKTTEGTLKADAIATGNVKLQVRTAASAKGVASKIYAVVVTEAAIADDVIGKDVTVGYKVSYDKSKGLTIANKSTTDVYEYCLTTSGASVTATDKWSAIKAGKSVDVKSLQSKDKKDYTTIHIRKQGDKKAGLLSSKYVDQAISAIPSTPQAITVQTGTGAAVAGVTNATFSYTTAGAVTITVPVETVSAAAVEGKTVDVPVTGMVNPGTLKWASKGSNKAYTLDVPTYADGKVTFKFSVKKGTAAGDSGEYKCKVESLEFTVKVVVK